MLGKRIAYDAIMFFSVLFLPWWCFIFIVFVGGLLCKKYYEAFVAGLFMDALYGTGVISFYGFHLFFSLAGFSLIVFIEFLKKKIRFFDFS